MYIKRRSFIRIISFLCAVILVLTGACIYVNYEKTRYSRALSNDYAASFDELSSHIYNIETAFYKGLYSQSPYQMVKMATKVWGEAMAAKTNIEGLYGYSHKLNTVSEFLSKAGDYVYYTALKRIKDEELTKEDWENLEALAKTATYLSENINSIAQRLNSGEIDYDEITIANLTGTVFEENSSYLSSDLVSSVDQVSGYPELIYDGPFSDHIEKQESVFLKNMPEISRTEAKNRLCNWFEIPENEMIFAYENSSKIPCYVFNFGDYTAAISKQGGYLAELVCASVFSENKLNPEQAIEIAEEFIELQGISNMEENYYYISGNEITVNFAYNTEDVTVYPDLIKVTVSLENGEVSGYEALGYLMAHREDRNISTKISLKEARSKVSSLLDIKAEGVAIIPTDGKNEVLCYEFATQADDGRRVLVYINANTATEEMLQILLENESGTLTQ